MANASFSTIILAAGKGTRMRSELPKVLHRVAGRPLVAHVVHSVVSLRPQQVITVVANGMESVQKACTEAYPACAFAIQQQQRGTGDAVQSAVPLLGQKADYVLILYGDTPLMQPETLLALIDKAAQCDIAVLGMRMADPTGYGRLVTEADGRLVQIVEHKDAGAAQRAINLCNSGIMVVRAKYLCELLSKLTPNNSQKEYYLTDIIEHAGRMNLRCMVVEADSAELAGINTRAQLAEAEAVVQQRLRNKAMVEGATLIDPSTVYFSMDTTLGTDVVVHPFVVFGPKVSIGNGVEIRSYSHIEGATVANRVTIGPFTRLRPGTVVEDEAHIGNFVELKATTLGRGAKANHLSYIGDSEVGAGANIGAGTITCNYDGVNKYKTTIGEGAFIGSNTSLVAPVSVGAGAIIGAGSVITEDVAADALALSRPAQIVKPGRAANMKKNNKKQ